MVDTLYPLHKKTVAVIQARMNSSRLPGKSLMLLNGKPVLQWCVDALKASCTVDEIIVATSNEPDDAPIAQYCRQNSISVYCGSKNNVLERMFYAAKEHKADLVVRITADCPFLDSTLIDSVVFLHKQENCDYASNVEPTSWPDGLDCEVFTVKLLEESLKKAQYSYEKEHVNPYALSHYHEHKIRTVSCPIPGLSKERWTLDNQDDYRFLSAIAEKIKPGTVPTYTQILQILKQHPQIYALQSQAERNNGAVNSSAQEYFEADRNFSTSAKILEEAEKYIPLGSQTFSKSKINFPVGASPLFLTHGRGSRVWDIDGNEYIDYISGLLPISLGYCDPDVDYAIKTQMDRGISFSLATTLEKELAQRLSQHIPCAEQVRFGKNGTDATSAAIRLARAYKGRERVIALGYHGWQDWYIGSTTRNLGVPKAVCELTHRLPYNNIDVIKEEIKKYKGEIAAIILEPASAEEPQKNYLEELRAITEEEDIVLIFDEIIMGFRIAIGGAQAYYGVTPDLASFGKGMANGMPLSAIVGKEKFMRLMNDVFFSGTFGGESLSLAASIATIDKMVKVNAIDHMHKVGNQLASEVEKLINKYQLSHIFKLIGIAPWKIMTYKGTNSVHESVIQTKFVTEMFKRGILTGGSHNISFSHSQNDIAATVRAYDHVLGMIKKELDDDTLLQSLSVEPIKPVFKVRG